MYEEDTESLLNKHSSGEVASNGDSNQPKVVSIAYLDSEDIGKLTDTEEVGVVAPRVEFAMSKSVTISNEPPLVREDDSNTRGGRGQDQVYTVEDAIEYMGFGPFQILITIFAGMVWISDAMEVMLLSVLSPIVTCDWHLENWEEAMITSIVFVGFLIGGLFWGVVSDIIGRKKVLIIVIFLILLFGLGSAAAPDYGSLLVFRCLAGFGIGGTAQAVTYYTEFLPKKFRGVCLVLLEVWWAIGSVLAALLALAVIPNVPDPIETSNPDYDHIHWRIYIGLCALPMAIVLVFFLFVPESARFFISRGDFAKGEKVIASIARINMKPPPSGRLVSQEEKEYFEAQQEAESAAAAAAANDLVQDPSTESSFMEQEDERPEAPLLQTSPTRYTSDNNGESEDEENHIEMSRAQKIKTKVKAGTIKVGQDLMLLFTGGMWKTSVLLFFLWLGCAWLYYGAILLTTTILETGYDPHCGHINRSIDSNCQNLTTSFYLKIVWTSAAEFPGIIITLIIIELIGRKITMAVEFFGTAVFFGLLLICVPNIWLTVFLFGARGFVTGVFQAVYVYTPEVFPTKVRGVGLGVMTAAARIGAIITPFAAQPLFVANDYVTISLYTGSALLLIVLSLLLPIETKGRSLKDTKG